MNFQQVVHPAPVEEDEVVEALAVRGGEPDKRSQERSSDVARSRADRGTGFKRAAAEGPY